MDMKFSRESLSLLIALVSGGCAGAIVSFLLVPQLESPVRFSEQGYSTSTQVNVTSTRPIATTSTVPTISLVQVERRTVAPLAPPSFLQRRSSPIASIYKKPKGTAFDDRLLGPDKMLGHAVALTSDGWFVTSASVFDGVRFADLTVWENGASYPIEKGVIDKLNNTAFFKTSARGLTAPAFAQSNEVTLDEQVWVEAHPNGFDPDVIVDDRARVTANDYASSETAVRRFVLSGRTSVTEKGAAVWDPNGSLLGIIESKEGEDVRLIPASTIAASFASLLTTGDIRHAQLGVHALDLAAARFDGSRGNLPEQGALLKVRADSPAGKAKLKNGDVILRVERDILDGTADLGEVLADYRPGAVVTLRVLRAPDTLGGQSADVDVAVTLGSLVTSEPLK